MNYHAKKKHSNKQKTAVKKVTAKKKAATKKVAKKKKPAKKLLTFAVFVRKNRSGKRVQSEETITHYNIDTARQLAASKNPGHWVSVSPLRRNA